jgi:hypothetical protein
MGNDASVELKTHGETITKLEKDYETLNTGLQTLMGKMLTTSSTNNNFTGLNDGTAPVIEIDSNGNVISNNTRWFSKPEVSKFLSGSSTGQIPQGPYAPAFYNSGTVPSVSNPLITQSDLSQFPSTLSISPFALANTSPTFFTSPPIAGTNNILTTIDLSSSISPFAKANGGQTFFTTQPVAGTNPIMTLTEFNGVQSLAENAISTSLSASSLATVASLNAATALDRASNVLSLNALTNSVATSTTAGLFKTQPINALDTATEFNPIVTSKDISSGALGFSSSVQPFLARRNTQLQPIINNRVTTVLYPTIIQSQGSTITYNNTNGEFTITSPGLYEISTKVHFEANGALATRSMFFTLSSRPDGRLGSQQITVSTDSNIDLSASIVFKFAVGEGFHVSAFQNSGRDANMSSQFEVNFNEIQIVKLW